MAELTSLQLFFAFVVALVMFAGLYSWIKIILLKINPDFKWWFKYNIRRKKYDELDVTMLLEDAQNDVDNDEMFKVLLISNKFDYKRCEELLYIFKQMKNKLKGGKEK